MQLAGKYSLDFTRGIKQYSTICTRPKAENSKQRLSCLRKGVRPSLEREKRRAADNTANSKTTFSELDSQTALRVKELGGSKDDACTHRSCVSNIGIRLGLCCHSSRKKKKSLSSEYHSCYMQRIRIGLK
ncbi:uncharacterized protein LOC113286281 isoform X2 [Papaver somniferum]|uniref:uncharacterized protein LOC113286281 isoform X2 n=1 Tax=Papaver somniferum TaxID=3469 RepID=UPI000E6F87E4|nr:uncharacterized protein LOC113286281 isoform X2 [Papaver somniferum]